MIEQCKNVCCKVWNKIKAGINGLIGSLKVSISNLWP